MTGGDRQLATAAGVGEERGRKGRREPWTGMGQAYSLVGAPRPTDMRGLLVLLLCRSTLW